MYQPSLPKVHKQNIQHLYFCNRYLVIAYVLIPTTEKCSHSVIAPKRYNFNKNAQKWHTPANMTTNWKITLKTTTKLCVILLTESQQCFWGQSLWNTNHKNGFNHFWMFVTSVSMHHLDLYCSLIIEAWLKTNIRFDCRYLELWNACIISLLYIVLNVRDGTESKYHSIVFLSIHKWSTFLSLHNSYGLMQILFEI